MNNNLLPIAFLLSSCIMMSCQLNAENLKTKVNNAPVEMIEVRGGSFMMGDHNKQNKDALPLHKVTLDSYYVGRTEVTQQLWEAVMGYNNSTYKGEYRPVESIDYEEIMSFLKKLNTMTGIKFRLLTEAEWEFAARGGLFSKGYVIVVVTTWKKWVGRAIRIRPKSLIMWPIRHRMNWVYTI